MKDRILVVGGYGHVGKQIAQQLGERYPQKVIAAGRDFSKAKAFCDTTNGKVQPMALDVQKPVEHAFFEHVELVIMCLDQIDVSFVQACFEHHVAYIDVSANYDFLQQIEQLEPLANQNQTSAVLSVGLAPGLTNLLAAYVQQHLHHTEAIDISIMLGLGDAHGKAALEWTIQNMNRRYEVVEKNEKKRVESFRDGKATTFGHLGLRKAFRFNFSDQHVLPRTLGVPTVSTRLCFDSSQITQFMAFAKRMKVLQLLQYPFWRKSMLWLLQKLHWGKPLYAIKVNAWGEVDGSRAVAETFFYGEQESTITAMMAAEVAKKLYEEKELRGVYHIEQLFDLIDFQDVLQLPEVSVSEKGAKK